MHFTEPVYRNPYWPTWPLLEVTRGCTHNKCAFCTMYKDVRFGVAPMDQIEADLAEIATMTPRARTIQLLSANPLALSYDRMAPVLEKINQYLPDIEHIYAAGRVTDLRNKTVEQLRALRNLGLDETGIAYWHTFLNGVAGRSHSREHALHSAEVFNQTHPMVVGTGGLTLFPGTPLLEDVERGAFDPLTEREMMEEELLFVEHLTCDCAFITHHTIGGVNLTGPNFLQRKEQIVEALKDELEHADMDLLAWRRSQKQTL